MLRKIVWIFCLSADKNCLLEDTIWNIECAIEYLRTCKPDEIAGVVLTGDIHLKGKENTVPRMMFNYVQEHYPNEWKTYFLGQSILEHQSLTSRENIPFSLRELEYVGLQPTGFDHILCSERKHTWILCYLLRYHLQKRAHAVVPDTEIQPIFRMPEVSCVYSLLKGSWVLKAK